MEQYVRALGLFACGLASCIGMVRAVAADGHTLANARLSFVFGSDAHGYTTNDADRVDAITWLNSGGTPVTNYVTSGGPLHCGDPQEFFGEAYGDTGDTGVPLPNAVVGGVTSTWSGTGKKRGTATIASLTSCDETLDATTTTTYQMSAKATLVSTLRITRSFTFSASPASGNLRVYVPRLPLGTYPYVLAPDAGGTVQTYNANNCPLNCVVTDWNAKWFADDDGNGNGMAVIRGKAGKPAQLTVDWDGYSDSNNTAITVLMPKQGWAGVSFSEDEYLCFYDSTTWPAAQRNAGQLPAGCTGISP
jgi:hypothetical protein